MTPICEEEVESTMSANLGSPARKEPDVNTKKAANATVPDGKEEEIETSSSASTIVPVREEEKKEELESGMIVIGYFFQVPCVKWHPKLEMMSKAGLSQGQYERKVLAQGYVYNSSSRLSGTRSLIRTSSQHHVKVITPMR